MSMLQELEESLRSDAPVFIEFLYRYKPKQKQVFAFYEGDEDASYYHHAIKGIIDKDCELEELVAGCKNNVLKLQREFDWSTYQKTQIAFFVDRDLSFWLSQPSEPGDNVFVTDDYSVENYVTNAVGFRAWLIHFEGFARAKKAEIDHLIVEYELLKEVFYEKMKIVMAQAVVAKRHDPTISLSDFKISNNSISFNCKDDHIFFDFHPNKRYCEKWHITDEMKNEINIQVSHFNENEEHYSVRGKWSVRFMAEMGEYMRLNAGVFAPSLGKCTLKRTCSVHCSDCFPAIAPYCMGSTPHRLETFLNRTYRSYCTSYSN